MFNKIKRSHFFRYACTFLQNIRIPVLNGISLYQIISVYFIGIIKGSIGSRATVASWSLFMSIFPFVIFVLQLISYLPFYDDLQILIYDYILKNVLPNNFFDMANEYMHESSSLFNKTIVNAELYIFIFMIITFIIVSSNGLRSLIKGFQSINSTRDKSKGIREWIISVALTIFFAIFISSSLLIFYTTEVVFKYFEVSFPSKIIDHRSLINVVNIIVTFLVFFFGFCFLYYLPRTKEFYFKEVALGALLTTTLCLLTAYFFGYYIRYFTRLNALYGSIGSILLLMIWVKVNVILILIGYELNVAIKKAKMIINDKNKF